MLSACLFHCDQRFHKSPDRDVIGEVQVVPYIDYALQLWVYDLITPAGLQPLSGRAQLLCQTLQSINAGACFSAFPDVPDIGVRQSRSPTGLGFTDLERLKALLDTLCKTHLAILPSPVIEYT
jgi:hypothetical protein